MKIIIALLLAAFLGGCTRSTMYGPCVGLGDDRNPNLVYKISVWNTILAIVFAETIVVPVVVVIDELYCPSEVR